MSEKKQITKPLDEIKKIDFSSPENIKQFEQIEKENADIIRQSKPKLKFEQ